MEWTETIVGTVYVIRNNWDNDIVGIYASEKGMKNALKNFGNSDDYGIEIFNVSE